MENFLKIILISQQHYPTFLQCSAFYNKKFLKLDFEFLLKENLTKWLQLIYKNTALLLFWFKIYGNILLPLSMSQPSLCIFIFIMY